MSDKWLVQALPIHGARIVNEKGDTVVDDIYDDEIAAQIVREHNAHKALVDAIESRAADAAMRSGLGVSEWRSCLTAQETEALALAGQTVARASKGE